VEKGKKSELIWGRVMAEEEFSAGEICASSKAVMGMLAANGDKLAMVAFVFV
jgi:hypothetical protein